MKLKAVDLDFLKQWGPKIGPTGIAIYHVLYLHRDAERQPYRWEVAQIVGCCKRSVIRKLAHLADLGLIDKSEHFTPRGGYIYVLLGDTQGGVYKIGHTTKLSKRLGNFEVVLPFDIETTHTFHVDDRYAAEGILHKRFVAKHMNGEWFALDAADVAWIRGIERFETGEFVETAGGLAGPPEPGVEQFSLF